MTASARDAKIQALLESQNVRYSKSESSEGEVAACAKSPRTSTVTADINTSWDLPLDTRISGPSRVLRKVRHGRFSPSPVCRNLRKMHPNHSDVINADCYD